MAARKTTPNTIPDALGGAGKTRLLAEQLGEIQARRFRLDMQQECNGSPDDDEVIGLPADKDGKVSTYGEQREMLKKAERRLADAYPKLMPGVRALIRDAAEAG